MNTILQPHTTFEDSLSGKPCSEMALVSGYRYFHPEIKRNEAIEIIEEKISALKIKFHADGWCSLQDFNKIVRHIFVVHRNNYKCYEMSRRPILHEFLKGHPDIGPCFITVYGYSIFVDNKLKYSCTEYIDNDPVVAVWKISDVIGNPKVVG